MIKVCSCHVSPPLRNFIIFWQLGGQVVPIERQLFWLNADFQYENRSNNRHVYDLRCRRRKVNKIRKKTHAHRPLHFQLSLRSTTFRYFELHQLFLVFVFKIKLVSLVIQELRSKMLSWGKWTASLHFLLCGYLIQHIKFRIWNHLKTFLTSAKPPHWCPCISKYCTFTHFNDSKLWS